MSEVLERQAVITGVGLSDMGRRLNRTSLSLTVDAALAAIDDAGLTMSDIDGVATYPGDQLATSGYGGPSTFDTINALGLQPNWFQAGSEGPAQLQCVVNACMAVATGLARHVLVYRTVTESTAQGRASRSAAALSGENTGRSSGSMSYLLPFGSVSPVNWFALFAQRHLAEYGVSREQLGQIAVVARRHAALNPNAVYRHPMTMDDYLQARMISTPLCLFDCDVPIDGSTALIVSHLDRAGDLRHPAVHVNAVGTASYGRMRWDQWDDLLDKFGRDAARQMWNRTELGPGDIDVALLYDGFSIMALLWLESLGFCPRGQAGSFVADGTSISLGGELPLNTDGGQLSAGRLHGLGFVRAACLQLRGEAGERQVANAEVAVVSNGGGPLNQGCMLLTR
jgi:acetyl-CoA acetyltransferase